MAAQASSVEAAPPKEVVSENASRRIVKSYASFEELPPAYHRLFEEASSRSFFHSLDWYRILASATLGKTDQIRVLGVEREDRASTPIAALPLKQERGPQSRWKLRTLSSLSNYYTTLYEPLFDSSGCNENSLRELARTIGAESPAWDAINLKPLSRDSKIFDELVRSLQQAGFVVQTYFCFGNWYLPVAGRGFREYFSSLPSAVQNTIKRKRKKLEQTSGVSIEIVTGGEKVESAIASYEKIYAHSWKIPEPYPEFIRSLIRLCSGKGWLRLGMVYIDGQPAAAQLWIVNSGKASIYKLAYDERFSNLSAGTVLTALLMEHVLDIDKVQEVDYLTGDDPYKKGWMSHRRENWGILAMNPRTIPGALAIVRHVGGRAVKRSLLGLLSRFKKNVSVEAASH